MFEIILNPFRVRLYRKWQIILDNTFIHNREKWIKIKRAPNSTDTITGNVKLFYLLEVYRYGQFQIQVVYNCYWYFYCIICGTLGLSSYSSQMPILYRTS